jgi:hypothetical protein
VVSLRKYSDSAGQVTAARSATVAPVDWPIASHGTRQAGGEYLPFARGLWAQPERTLRDPGCPGESAARLARFGFDNRRSRSQKDGYRTATDAAGQSGGSALQEDGIGLRSPDG